MIAVIDYGMGNLHSVQYALDRVGADVCLARHPEEVRAAERIVLPGVGTFGACVDNLTSSGLLEVLEEDVLRGGKPFFGICLGMQVLARDGEEGGRHQGLGWISASVQRLDVDSRGLKVPHVGWNEITPRPETPLFRGFRKTPAFYFVHSYHLITDDSALVAATCEYGMTFTAAILRDNLFATQFHPEKSQEDGLRLLENFLDWKP